MQDVDLYQPITATRVGPPPAVLRVITRPNNNSLVGGVPAGSMKAEAYVLLSALPTELQERVKIAVQALIAGR
jgi:hypothetical protein